MDLIFAFALNHDNQFEAHHFGDAQKFAIYKQEDDRIVFKKEIENIHRKGAHGDPNKGNSIIQFLKQYDVNVIVSREFGKNIIMVNKHFIPVLIAKEHPDKVVKILQDKLHWILDEWNSSSADFKLFNINSSVLKLKVEG